MVYVRIKLTTELLRYSFYIVAQFQMEKIRFLSFICESAFRITEKDKGLF